MPGKCCFSFCQADRIYKKKALFHLGTGLFSSCTGVMSILRTGCVRVARNTFKKCYVQK